MLSRETLRAELKDNLVRENRMLQLRGSIFLTKTTSPMRGWVCVCVEEESSRGFGHLQISFINLQA